MAVGVLVTNGPSCGGSDGLWLPYGSWGPLVRGHLRIAAVGDRLDEGGLWSGLVGRSRYCSSGFSPSLRAAIPAAKNRGLSQRRPRSMARFETEQLFLKDADGAWVILTFGTGIDCATETDWRPAELEDACRALGLR